MVFLFAGSLLLALVGWLLVEWKGDAFFRFFPPELFPLSPAACFP